MNRAARAACAVLLAAAAPALARAAAAPRWVRDAVPAVEPAGGDAVVLLDHTDVKVERDRSLTLHHRRVLRVRTGEGARDAAIAVALEPGAALDDVAAWTIGDDGVRATAGRLQIAEIPLSNESLSDGRLLVLGAPEVRAGDLVAFESTEHRTEPFPFFHWRPQVQNLATARAELVMDLPHGWSAEVHGSGLPRAIASSAGERVEVTLDALPRLPGESRRPDDDALLPVVAVRFVSSETPLGFESWPAVATWYAEATRAAAGAGACPAELAAAAVNGAPAVRVAQLAARVQTGIRYAAIELGRGRWIPDPAAETWQRRYGDCKNKAALLASALAAAGVEARLVLVKAGRGSSVDPGSPDPLQFNHCIVAIAWPGSDAPPAATITGPSGRAWTIFDPTDDATSLGMIAPWIGGTWALIADPREGLVRLPAATRSTREREVRARLDETGDLEGHATLRAEGPAGGALAYGLDAPTSGQRSARVAQMIQRRWPRARIDSCAVTIENHAVTVDFSFALPGVARPLGGALLFAPELLSAWTDAPPRDTTRTLPLLLDGPETSRERWTIELPPGFVPESRPATEWRGDFGAYAATSGGAARSLVLERRLDLAQGEVAAARWPEASALWRAVWAGDHPAILLERR